MRYFLATFKAALLVALLALSMPGLSCAEQCAEIGRVVGLQGAATVVHEGSQAAVALNVGEPVYLMDRITTSPHSRIKLLMADDSIMTMGQEGELVLSEFEFNPEKARRVSVLKLITGSVRCIVSKFFRGVGSKFEVHTPTAVAGARGTINIVSVINPERTLVVGMRGLTHARNMDPDVEGEVELTDGNGSYVDKGKPPTAGSPPGDILGPIMEDTALGHPPRYMPGDGKPGTPGFEPEGGPGPKVPLVPPADQQPHDPDPARYQG